MKFIRELKTPTSGLAEYLEAVGDEANWDEFRSRNSGASYRELRESLTQNQHGICGYCEISITWIGVVRSNMWSRSSDDENGKKKAV